MIVEPKWRVLYVYRATHDLFMSAGARFHVLPSDMSEDEEFKALIEWGGAVMWGEQWGGCQDGAEVVGRLKAELLDSKSLLAAAQQRALVGMDELQVARYGVYTVSVCKGVCGR